MAKLIPDTKLIETVIDALGKAISEGKITSSFAAGADEEKISLFEKAFGVELPPSFKTFLSRYDGGFVVDEEANWYWMNGEYDEAKRLSMRILSIDEIIEAYEDMKIDAWKLKPGFDGYYPYIPFCITPDDEKLIFINKYKPGMESSVYAAFHDAPASAWFAAAGSFTEFFIDYLNTEGKPDLFKNESNVYAEDYLYFLNGKKAEIENPKNRIKRYSAYLELYPESDVTYTSRGNAYRDDRQFEKALADYNKGIALDEKYALTYYCRGNMLLALEKARQALTDLDSACQLEPDDPFYLTGRAEAFYALNRMDEALADCNRAIELDQRYLLAYMTRYNIYLYQGEATKAEADAEMIDELVAEDE